LSLEDEVASFDVDSVTGNWKPATGNRQPAALMMKLGKCLNQDEWDDRMTRMFVSDVIIFPLFT
jgi:hypothetical protein